MDIVTSGRAIDLKRKELVRSQSFDHLRGCLADL